jgi:hypothetical protein
MRSLLKSCITIALLGACVQPVSAQQVEPAPMITTGSLAKACGAPSNSADYAAATGFCRGFLIGVGQFHHQISQPGGTPPLFCLSNPAPSLDAAQAAFVAWSARHTQYDNDRAVDGMVRWASSAYPCPPQAAPRHARR